MKRVVILGLLTLGACQHAGRPAPLTPAYYQPARPAFGERANIVTIPGKCPVSWDTWEMALHHGAMTGPQAEVSNKMQAEAMAKVRFCEIETHKIIDRQD